jgi:hypothetical protein
MYFEDSQYVFLGMGESIFSKFLLCGLLKYHHPKTKKNKNKNTRKDWSLLLS